MLLYKYVGYLTNMCTLENGWLRNAYELENDTIFNVSRILTWNILNSGFVQPFTY
jgi:hypothetical protein